MNEYRIVYYHGLEDSKLTKKSNFSLRCFERQLRWFEKTYKIISLDEAIFRYNNNQSLNNYLSLTFDDGFREVYTSIFPVLKQKKIKAAFFIIGNCLDNKSLMWRNKLKVIEKSVDSYNLKSSMLELSHMENIDQPGRFENLSQWSKRTWDMNSTNHLSDRIWEMLMKESVIDFLNKQRPYLSSEEVKELIEEGNTIGSHTSSHPFCSKLTYENYKEEVSGSLSSLSNKLNYNVRHFSYPFGDRAPEEFERKLIDTDKIKVDTLLGTKNYNCNNSLSPYSWERDRMQLGYFHSLLRFRFLPMLRKRKQ